MELTETLCLAASLPMLLEGILFQMVEFRHRGPDLRKMRSEIFLAQNSFGKKIKMKLSCHQGRS